MKTASKQYPKSVQKVSKRQQTNPETQKNNQKRSNKFVNQKHDDWPTWKLVPQIDNQLKQSSNKQMKQKHLNQLAQTKNKTISSTTTNNTRGKSQISKMNKNLLNSPYLTKKLEVNKIKTKAAKIQQKQKLFKDSNQFPCPIYTSRGTDTIYFQYFYDKEDRKLYFFPLKDKYNKVEYCQSPLKQLPPFSDTEYYQQYRNKWEPIHILTNESIIKQLQKYKTMRLKQFNKFNKEKKEKAIEQFYFKIAKLVQFNLQ